MEQLKMMEENTTATTEVKRKPIDPSKLKAIETAMANIDKQFGKGSVMMLSKKSNMDVESISTGDISIDLALGVGGVPRGRIIEIYGPESSGKTTLAMHIMAEAQKNGEAVAIIDAEHSFDAVYAESIGCDVDSLLISQPDCGEQGAGCFRISA